MTFTIGFGLVVLLAAGLSFLTSKLLPNAPLKLRSFGIGLLIGWLPFFNTLKFIGMAGLPSYIFLVFGYLFFAFVVAFPVAYFVGRWLKKQSSD